jgi:hypothetical protein
VNWTVARLVVELYWMYAVVAVVCSAVAYSYGYASGYKLARRNEVERARQRQKQGAQAFVSGTSRQRRARRSTRL